MNIYKGTKKINTNANKTQIFIGEIRINLILRYYKAETENRKIRKKAGNKDFVQYIV